MENTCENIQEQILELIADTLSAERKAELQQHIAVCPGCSKYLQDLQGDDRLLGDFVKVMQQTVARLENNVIDALNREPLEKPISSISIWRKIIKNRITKVAAAAVVVLGVYFGLKFLGGPIDGASVAFAKVEESMRQVPWVHMICQGTWDGNNIKKEWWVSFAKKTELFKDTEGRIHYEDFQNNKQYVYDPQSGEITIAYLSRSWSWSHTRPPLNYWAVRQQEASALLLLGKKIRRSVGKYNGKKVDIYTVKLSDKKTSTIVKRFVDPKTNLIIAELDKQTDSKGNITGEAEAVFLYPEDGPKDIYAIGVPKDAEIVYNTTSDIETVIKKLDTLRERKLTNYVAISVQSDIEQAPTSFISVRPKRYFTLKDNLVSSIWRRGDDRIHSMGYFPKEKGAILSLKNISENVQGAAEALVAVSSDIYQSNKIPKHIHHYQLLNGEVVRNVRRGEVEVYGSEIFLEQICWPHIVVPTPRLFHVKWETEVVVDSNGESLIMIERTLEYKGVSARWYLDPARDYICVRNEFVCKTNERCIEILEYARTSDGHYYPKVIRKKNTEITGSSKTTEELIRYIYLQIEPEYPEGLFDPVSISEVVL